MVVDIMYAMSLMSTMMSATRREIPSKEYSHFVSAFLLKSNFPTRDDKEMNPIKKANI